MPREQYQSDLSDLRRSVLELGDAALQQVDSGLNALEEGDSALAEDVIQRDGSINDRYLELEADCIDLFALQQPVASDLRFVASTFKILTDIERVGDLATNFGKYALAEPRPAQPIEAVVQIGRDARSMTAAALEAYESESVEGCFEVAARDDEIDTRCQEASTRVVRELVERESDSLDSWGFERLLDDVSRLLLAIRDVERVGDHAVNIAARTLYMTDQESSLLY